MSDDNTQETLDTVYTFICQYMSEHGYAPSQRDIAFACFISQSAITHILDRLQIQGRIVRTVGRARSIRLTQQPDDEELVI